MRATITLSVDPETAEFIRSQPGTEDPSAIVNKLIQDEMKRKGVTIDQRRKTEIENDEVLQQFELLLDEDTHASG